MNRFNVSQVKCLSCSLEQKVASHCASCGIKFGSYFCAHCRLYDYDTSKQQFHCADCGVCRQGGRENFFHCKTCGCCVSKAVQSNHKCLENVLS